MLHLIKHNIISHEKCQKFGNDVTFYIASQINRGVFTFPATLMVVYVKYKEDMFPEVSDN